MEYQEIVVGDTAYQFPNDMSDDDIQAALRSELNGQQQPLEGEVMPRYQPFGEVGKDIDPASLAENEDWLRASALIYQMRERKPFDGSPEELSDWGRSHMAWFNYNLFSTGHITADVLNADQQTKEAFLHMMDTFDNTNMSWQGAGNTAKALASDPTSWVGLSSLGLGNVVKLGAGQAGKAALRHQLATSLGRTGVVAGVEGGIYNYADDRMRQNIEVSAGRMEETSAARSAVAAGTGVVAGVVIGTGLDAGLSTVGRKLGRQEAPQFDAPEQLTAGGQEQIARVTTDALPPRELAPEIPTREVAGFTIPAEPGMLNPRSDMGEVRAYAEILSRQLEDLPPEVTSEALSPLMNSNLSLKEFADLKASVQLASNRLTHRLADVTEKVRTATDDDLINLQREQGDLIHLQAKMEQLDHILRSDSGRNLRARQEGETDLNDLSFEKIREELKGQGLSKADLDDAVEAEYTKRYNRVMNSRAHREQVGKIDAELEEALLTKDMQKVVSLAMDKRKLRDDLMGGSTAQASVGHKLAEMSISNVFSATTLMINLVPSATKGLGVPGMKALLSNPLQKATRVEAAASYGAMRTSMGSAWRAAKAAWRYEQAIMSHDPNRFLESHLAVGGNKVSGNVAPYMRAFLRGINATDEFLTRINYNAYVSGKAAAQAAEDGMAMGMKGAALERHIKNATKEAMDNAYRIENAEVLLDPILRKGENLGLRGKELEEYIRREAARDPEILVRAGDEQGLDYVRELLYKRGFSGNSSLSYMALKAEDTMNKFPITKLVSGQLFFRTPIRVIEEGLKFTPGLNYLIPGFHADLAGKNGPERQIKARGEALMSFTFAAAAATLWAEGRGRGDGGYEDWRQQRLQQDSAVPDPYTIKMDDGSTWNYRFFDPVATPLKVIFNAYERLDRLRVREAQGEFVDQAEYKRALALVTVGSGAIIGAVRDANLLTGVDQMIENIEMIGNPEDSNSLFVRNFGERLRYLVPNTLHKANRAANPEMMAPADHLQMIEQQLLRPVGLGGQIMTSQAYDHLGRPRTLTDTGALFNIFSTASVEEREKGRSETELFVDRELVRLQQETGLVLRYPFQHSMTGDLDLRTVATQDGQETLYDRWNRYYSEIVPVDHIAEVLRSPAPEGTYKHKAAKVEAVRSLMNQARDGAFMRLFGEEQTAIERFQRDQQRQAESQAGLWDADRKTVRQPRFETPWSQ